jgi:prepilin-type N-terminal cleavage/methylation domain-containing protein
MKTATTSDFAKSEQAFTLIEILVASSLLGIMFVTFYGGIAAGLSIINLSRENLRANQIVIEKMETIRLYSWDQINSNGFIPSTFSAEFYPTVAGDTNRGSGITYFGTMLITNAPIDASYSTNLKLVKVSLIWTNNRVQRERTMETMVSEFGMQNYIY